MSTGLKFPIHHPDPELEQLAKDSFQDLQNLQGNFEAGAEIRNAGAVLSIAAKEASWDVIKNLCADGYYLHAGAIAMLMAARLPADSRFQTLAGRILLRLGDSEAAGAFFARALAAKSDPVAAYLLGGCLANSRESEAAKKLFEAAREMCRGQEDQLALREKIEVAIQGLDKAPQSA